MKFSSEEIIRSTKKLLVDQINDSPEPLRSYIYDLETSVGSIADLVQYTAGLEESVRLMEAFINGH